MSRTLRGVVAVCGVLACNAACETPTATLSPFSLQLPLPATCDDALEDLTALAFISGYDEPIPLDVDPATGVTTGSFEVAAGIERRLVIDWVVTRQATRVLLAQARATLPLEAPETAELTVKLSESDVSATDCRDVTGDLARAGDDFIRVDGTLRPVCDLDGDCGDTLADECSNLGELCAGRDPLRP
ncbi:MAG: hypothetical protein ACO3JL_08260 [Myxococcota bacterium]